MSGYGIIPNQILFDEDLTDKQKILYCFISSLAKNTPCIAGNDYIANKMGVTKNTISRNINILEKKGYFKIENPLNYNRKIYIKNIIINDEVHNHKSLGTSSQIVRNIIINDEHNNISNNIREYIYMGNSSISIKEELEYIIGKWNELVKENRTYNIILENIYKEKRTIYTYDEIKTGLSNYVGRFDIKNNDKKYLLSLNKVIGDNEKGFINYL